jgi:parallel beta-helix repeat protein
VWIVALAASFLTSAGLAEETPALVPHARIWIDGNDSFTKDNGVVAGKGTAADPFVIEGWLFEAGETGIGIANTDAFFVIRACRFTRISRFDPISFSGVRNGRVEDCVVDGTAGRCICLSDSSNCSIVQCDLTNTAEAAVIALWGCTQISVTDNVLRSVPSWTSWCGVVLWGTASSSVSRNAITDCGSAVALNRDVERGIDSVGNRVDSNTMSNSEGG